MRHRVIAKKLGSDADHTRSMVRNLASELIMHKSITTTITKAKFIKPYIERLITRANVKGSTHINVVYMEGKLSTKEAVRELLEKVAPQYKERKGGYTKLVRTKVRDGDKAVLAKIELI